MHITHLGHACLLVETAGSRLLIDPGTYSTGFEGLSGLDAIAVTHQHPDHLDPDRFPALIRANPDARLLVEPEAVQAHGVDGAASFGVGEIATVGDLEVQAVGGRHAFIHDQVAPLGNIGLLVDDGESGRLFHPGDSYDEAPEGVDVLALPLNAPWCRMSETLGFLALVNPALVIPIHDALLSESGHAAYLMHVEKSGPPGASVRRLDTGETFSLPGNAGRRAGR